MNAPREGTELGRNWESSQGRVVGAARVLYLRSPDVFKQKCLCRFCSQVDWRSLWGFWVGGSGGSPSVEPAYFSSVEWAQDPCVVEGLGRQIGELVGTSCVP